MCCMSSAVDGNYGCEVAFNMSTIWYTSMGSVHTRVQRENVTIVDYDPRFLICRCTMQHLDLYVVAAHAPYEGSRMEPKPWWVAFENSVRKHCRPSIPMLVCIDCNCQWYASDSFEAGDFGVLTSSPPANFPHMISFFRSL